MQKVSTSNVVTRDHRKPMRFSDFKQCRQKKLWRLKWLLMRCHWVMYVKMANTKVLKTLTTNHVTWTILYVWQSQWCRIKSIRPQSHKPRDWSAALLVIPILRETLTFPEQLWVFPGGWLQLWRKWRLECSVRRVPNQFAFKVTFLPHRWS